MVELVNITICFQFSYAFSYMQVRCLRRNWFVIGRKVFSVSDNLEVDSLDLSKIVPLSFFLKIGALVNHTNFGIFE